jgi:hypothetical protein
MSIDVMLTMTGWLSAQYEARIMDYVQHDWVFIFSLVVVGRIERPSESFITIIDPWLLGHMSGQFHL